MMDDNSAILELITEFLVSKNLLHTAQTLQHEWVNLYPGHSFPDINNLMEGHFTSAIPVEPTGPPQYMHSYHQQQHQIQQHHHQLQQQQLHHQQHLQQQHLQQQQQHNHHFNNMIRSGEMEDDHHHHHHPDEPMHEEEEEEEDDGLLDEDAEEEEGEEEEEEEGELEDDGEIGNGETEKEGEGDDTVSVDSAYSRILVEDISEIMDEITADEEDMGEIDPLANEVSPSDESESEMDEDDNNDAGEDEAEYEDEEGEGTEEGENADLDTIPQDEEEEEEEEGEERTEEEEEETTEQIHKPASRSPSPTRGVIESVTELLGQHIQTQRDEFYQEEGAESGEKDISVLEIATLHINDPVNQPIHSASPFSSSLEAKPLLSSSPLSPHDQDHYHGLRAYECDVTIVNYDNKKSGAMFSPLISPTPHSPTPVFSPGNVPAMRSPPPSTSSAAPSPLPHSSSVAPPLSPQTSRSALYRRDVASPLGKKHVHITNETGSPSRSNSNLSARHGSPPPPSPTSSRARLSTSASAPSALSLTVQDSPSPLSSSPSAPDTPSSTSLSSTPTTPPPPYCFNPTIPEILINAPTQSNNTNSATPNITTLNTVQSNGLISNKAEGTEGAGGRRASLDGRAGDVVMKDLSPRPEKAPFSYPVQVDDTIYDCFNLKIVHVKNRTGFESTKDFPIKPNTLVAGRYQILEFLDSAAFSKAVRALDLHTGGEVCMKIIKNNKDYVDQSLDEIKLLKYLNSTGDPHKYNILQLYDFFYYKEHLFIVTELLRENLYEFYKFTNENGHPPYFTMPRLQKVAQQCLHALEFIHSLDIIHTDLKPENILIKSYSRCEIKIIDFGSSCFTRDHLGSYVQSRDYRAVEVILGLPYSPKIDIWSLGCILAELFSGKVLFVNRSLATLLARVSALVGPIPADMIAKGRFSHKFFTKFNSLLYERDEKTGQYYFLQPKRISLKEWLKSDDDDFVDFIETLLSLRPDDRPTATAALQHKWLHKVYPPIN